MPIIKKSAYFCDFMGDLKDRVNQYYNELRRYKGLHDPRMAARDISAFLADNPDPGKAESAFEIKQVTTVVSYSLKYIFEPGIVKLALDYCTEGIRRIENGLEENSIQPERDSACMRLHAQASDFYWFLFEKTKEVKYLKPAYENSVESIRLGKKLNELMSVAYRLKICGEIGYKLASLTDEKVEWLLKASADKLESAEIFEVLKSDAAPHQYGFAADFKFKAAEQPLPHPRRVEFVNDAIKHAKHALELFSETEFKSLRADLFFGLGNYSYLAYDLTSDINHVRNGIRYFKQARRAHMDKQRKNVIETYLSFFNEELSDLKKPRQETVDDD